VFNLTMGVWTRFRRLSRRERRIVVEAAAAIVATRVGLRVAGFEPWRQLLVRLARLDRAIDVSTPEDLRSLASELARLTNSTANALVFHATCLERSLALWWLLRRRGIDAELRIGARKQGPRFEAHAWVDVHGDVLCGSGGDRERYAMFGEMGDSAPRLAGETE
jgi:hypothetical protein